MERITSIETDKKRLEKLILEMNNEKKEHVELLLSVTYDFYTENMKLRGLLSESQVAC